MEHETSVAHVRRSGDGVRGCIRVTNAARQRVVRQWTHGMRREVVRIEGRGNESNSPVMQVNSTFVTSRLSFDLRRAACKAYTPASKLHERSLSLFVLRAVLYLYRRQPI